MAIPAVTAGALIDPTTFGNAVADQLNDLPVKVAAGLRSATTDAGGLLTITFGKTFSAAPIVTASVVGNGSSQLAVHVLDSVSTTACQVRVTNNDAALVSSSVKIAWQAMSAT